MIAPIAHVPPCPPQGDHEPTPEYARRVLAYLQAQGTAYCSAQELDQADTAARLIICGYGEKLETHQAGIIQELSEVRHQIAATLARRQRQWFATARAILQAGEGSPDQGTPQDGPPSPQDDRSDDERAALLLRAALTQLMRQDGSQDGGGGTPARLQAPKPTKPSGGTALAQPRPAQVQAQAPSSPSRPATRAGDDIAF